MTLINKINSLNLKKKTVFVNNSKMKAISSHNRNKVKKETKHSAKNTLSNRFLSAIKCVSSYATFIQRLDAIYKNFHSLFDYSLFEISPSNPKH